MKVICNTTDFADAVGACTRLAGKSKLVKILENVKLEARNDELTVTGSDGLMTLVKRIPAQVEDDGALLLAGKTLADIAGKLPGGEVRLDQERTGVRLRAGAARMALQAMDADLYPEIAKTGEGAALTIPMDALRDAIRRTVYAAGNADMREILNGLHFKAAMRTLTVTACNGVELSTLSIALDQDAGEFEAIIPSAAAGEIEKLAKAGDVQLRATKSNIEASCGSATLYAQLIAGEYIRLDHILNRKFQTQTTIRRTDFLEAAERAAVTGRTIKLTVGEDRMRIDGNSQISDYSEALDIYHSGPDIVIAFDVRRIIGPLRAVDAETIDVQFDSPGTPALLTPSGDMRHRMMAFPVRV